MILTVDSGEVGALVLLDMSAAFDTIDHGIMLDVLRRRFGIQDAALDWFASYFVDRTQVVVTGTDSSSVRELKICVSSTILNVIGAFRGTIPRNQMAEFNVGLDWK